MTDSEHPRLPRDPRIPPQSPQKHSLLGIVFATAWVLIAGISVHDGFLAFLYLQNLPDQELNPLARLLLDLNRGNIWLLLAAKSCGTIAVCWFLLLLYWRHHRIGIVITLGVAFLQLLLLLILLKG